MYTHIVSGAGRLLLCQCYHFNCAKLSILLIPENQHRQNTDAFIAVKKRMIFN